jgi:hypothetical protein
MRGLWLDPFFFRSSIVNPKSRLAKPIVVNLLRSARRAFEPHLNGANQLKKSASVESGFVREFDLLSKSWQIDPCTVRKSHPSCPLWNPLALPFPRDTLFLYEHCHCPSLCQYRLHQIAICKTPSNLQPGLPYGSKVLSSHLRLLIAATRNHCRRTRPVRHTRPMHMGLWIWGL